MWLDYRGMSRKELEDEMERLQRDLADLEEVIGFDLMNTSAHISGRQVRKDEACLAALRERLIVVHRLLKSPEDS